MPGIVQELQRDALDPRTSISDLLRKALVVARELELSEFEDWVNSELNGYTSSEKIPEYRTVHGSLQLKDPYRGWVPVAFESARFAAVFSERRLGESIARLESIVNDTAKQSPVFLFAVPAELAHEINKGMGHQVGFMTDTSQLSSILQRVRTDVLNWSLTLKKAGILGEDMTFSDEERTRAAAASVTYVQNQTVIHGMNQSQIQQGTSHSTQTYVQQQVDLEKLSALIFNIRSNLDSFGLQLAIRGEVDAYLKTLDAQKDSPKPNSSIIKDALHSLRTVLEGAAGGALGSALPGILDLIKYLLS